MSFGSVWPVILVTIVGAVSASADSGPKLSYSTLLGGRDADFVSAIAIGKDGSLYAGGATSSTNFPLRNAVWSSCQIGPLGGCSDAFLLRLAPDGGSLIFSTYLQLTNTGVDQILDIDLDREGYVYVAGMASSNTGFVGKFTPEGGLVYLIRISGYPLTMARGVAADNEGNVYVTGVTLSSQFLVSNAFKPQIGAASCTPAGGSPFPQDAFVMKLDPAGRTIYSTYLGGDGNDEGIDVVADADGNAYVVGSTSSQNFPTVNALQTEYRGGHVTRPGSCEGGDFFLAKLDPTGQRLVYSTYLGGTGDDRALGVFVDSRSNPIVYGSTTSWDLPTRGAWSTARDGAFVAKFSKSTAELVYAGYVSGGLQHMATDASGLLYLVGATRNPGLPLVHPLQPFGGGDYEDVFVQVLDPWSGQIKFSSYLGASQNDSGTAVSADGAGSIYVGGSTNSTAFPLSHPFQASSGGFHDGFLAKISGAVQPIPPFTMVSSASFAGTGVLAPDLIASGFGESLSDQTAAPASLPLPLELNSTRVEITDAAGEVYPAPLFLVSPGQVNFLVPSGVPEGEVRVTVQRGQQTLAEGAASVSSIAPSLYSANASGAGVAAAAVTHVTPDGTQWHELIFDESAPVGQRTARPLAWVTDSEQIILVLFGTGIRGRSSLEGVRAEVGGQPAEVLYAGRQPAYAGLDQVNVRVPRTLAGRGEVPVALTVDGFGANTVTVKFK